MDLEMDSHYMYIFLILLDLGSKKAKNASSAIDLLSSSLLMNSRVERCRTDD